jgi:hypothetical protein
MSADVTDDNKLSARWYDEEQHAVSLGGPCQTVFAERPLCGPSHIPPEVPRDRYVYRRSGRALHGVDCSAELCLIDEPMYVYSAHHLPDAPPPPERPPPPENPPSPDMPPPRPPKMLTRRKSAIQGLRIARMTKPMSPSAMSTS